LLFFLAPAALAEFLISGFVTAQDSSPPSVVRKSFFAAGFAACGCKARSKKRESL